MRCASSQHERSDTESKTRSVTETRDNPRRARRRRLTFTCIWRALVPLPISEPFVYFARASDAPGPVRPPSPGSPPCASCAACHRRGVRMPTRRRAPASTRGVDARRGNAARGAMWLVSCLVGLGVRFCCSIAPLSAKRVLASRSPSSARHWRKPRVPRCSRGKHQTLQQLFFFSRANKSRFVHAGARAR